jgi:hypothetical protein
MTTAAIRITRSDRALLMRCLIRERQRNRRANMADMVHTLIEENQRQRRRISYLEAGVLQKRSAS